MQGEPWKGLKISKRQYEYSTNPFPPDLVGSVDGADITTAVLGI